MNTMEPMTMYKGMMHKMENSMEFTSTMSKPMMYGNGTNTMDLVIGMDATTAFLQDDTAGLCRFRIYERFALRLKDKTSVIRLEFVPGASSSTTSRGGATKHQ